MRWASTVSDEPRLEAAIDAAAASIVAQLDGQRPDLVVVFVSAHHQDTYARVPELIAARCAPRLLIGCSAGGVIGGGREVEERPGLSLTAAVLPDVELTPVHVESDEIPAPGADLVSWERLMKVPVARAPHFLLLPDPFSFDAESFLRGLDHAYPASRKIGGLASGAREPGVNALFLGEDIHREGLVGVGLTGNIEVDTVVAQGCRPIGAPMFITRCQGNALWELDGRPALDVLRELFERLPPADQQLARHALFLGIVMSEDEQEYRQGDFLIRNLIGMDSQRGALLVGAPLHTNAVVQFHLRDAATSAADVEQLLGRYGSDRGGGRPAGALLFSCLGRGMHLYGHPDHDTEVFRRHVGEVPLGGFFCNGEIGPVHGTTFLHGYTSAFGLFRGRAS